MSTAADAFSEEVGSLTSEEMVTYDDSVVKLVIFIDLFVAYD